MNIFKSKRKSEIEKAKTTNRANHFRFPLSRFPLLLALLTLAFSLQPSTLFGQPVPTYFTNLLFTGVTNDTTVNVTPPNNPTLFNGITYWFPIGGTNVPSTNGVAGINLIPGRYTVSLAGVARSWTVNVPNNGGLAINAMNYSTNLVVYSGITGVVGVGGITVFGPTGGTVTVSNNPASSGVQSVQPTNTLLSTVIGPVLWSSTNFDVFGTAGTLFGSLGVSVSNYVASVGLNNTNFTTAQIAALGTASSNYTTAQLSAQIATAGAQATNFASNIGLNGSNNVASQIAGVGSAATNFANALGANNTNFTTSQIGALGTASTNFANGIGQNLTNFVNSVPGLSGGAATNYANQIGANNTNFTTSQIGALGTASTNYANSIGQNLTNLVNTLPAANGSQWTNYANQVGGNNTNFTTVQVGSLGIASTNFANAIGLNGSNNTASAAGTLGTQSTNFALGIGANNTNFTTAQIGAAGSQATNYANSIGQNLTNFVNSVPGLSGTAATNYANQVGADNTNFTTSQIGTLGAASTNFANVIGLNGSNNTASAIGAAGSQATNFASLIGANNTNFTTAQIGSLGTASTNFANVIGLNGSNNVSSQIAGAGLASTNFANLIGANNTNFTASQIGVLGTASTNYTQAQVGTAGSQATNFANSIGANNTNYTQSQIATAGSQATNFANGIGSQSTNYANSVGLGATNLANTKVAQGNGTAINLTSTNQPVVNGLNMLETPTGNTATIGLQTGSGVMQFLLLSNGNGHLGAADFSIGSNSATTGKFIANQSEFAPVNQANTNVVGTQTNLYLDTNIIYVNACSFAGWPVVGYYFWTNNALTNPVNGAYFTNTGPGLFAFMTNGVLIESSATLTNSAWTGIGSMSTIYGSTWKGGTRFNYIAGQDVVGTVPNAATAATATVASNLQTGALVTNLQFIGTLAATNFTGAFAGDGSQVTNLNLSQSKAGMLPLNQWLALYGAGNPNGKSNAYHVAATIQTNNEIWSGPNFSQSNGWLFADVTLTNTPSAGIAYNGVDGNWGVAAWGANAAPNSYARFRWTVTIPPSGMPFNYFEVGVSTNTLANVSQISATANAKFVGLRLNTSQAFQIFNGGSGVIEFPAWGANLWTNGTYSICGFLSPSNLSLCVVFPSHTNEGRGFIPIPGNLSPSALSNIVAIWSGPGAILTSAGGRTNTQSINPRTGIEDRGDFLIFDNDSHVGPGQTAGDRIRLVEPSSYDSGSNHGNLAVVLHGNNGSYADPFDIRVSDEPTNGESVVNFFNGLLTNNFSILSFSGDAANTGHQDTWATSNSIACIDSAIAYARRIHPYTNIVLICESAGGASGFDYIASRHEKISAAVFMYSIYDITNRYPNQVSDINLAYGGSTAAQFATLFNLGAYSGDPSGIPLERFQGFPPTLIIKSFGDTVVTCTNQTDLFVKLMGGNPATSNATPTLAISTNLPLMPLLWDYGVNGASGIHGGQCFTTNALSTTLAFLQQALAISARDVSAIGADVKVNATLTSGGLLSELNGAGWFRTNAPSLNDLPNPGMAMMWNSNGLSGTNNFFVGANSNGVIQNLRMVFGP